MSEDDDRLECLICGTRSPSLGHHLRKAHDLSAADYRERFGLAPGTRLTNAPTHARFSQAGLSVPNAGELGRRVARYRVEHTTPEERSDTARKAAAAMLARSSHAERSKRASASSKARWAGMSAEERSAQARRGAATLTEQRMARMSPNELQDRARRMEGRGPRLDPQERARRLELRRTLVDDSRPMIEAIVHRIEAGLTVHAATRESPISLPTYLKYLDAFPDLRARHEQAKVRQQSQDDAAE